MPRLPKPPKLTGERPPRVPAYCLHRATGQAYVKVRGRVIYLGSHGSEASRNAYAAIVADVLLGREPTKPAAIAPTGAPASVGLTVREVCARFTRHAQAYYVKNGAPTNEAAMIEIACRRLVELLGDAPATAFGPVALKRFREHLVGLGLARSTTNQSVNRVRRAFRWAAAEELIPASVSAALAMVSGLRAGRTVAREPQRVLPVEDDVIERTRPYLPEIVADMCQLQRLSGMRPAEVCELRPADIDRSGEVWVYRPAVHKTQHHGRDRVVFIGPKGQAILLKYLARGSTDYCFRPMDSERRRRASLHAARVTPLSCGNRPGTNRRDAPLRRPGEKYTVGNYRQAIARACDRAGVPRWSPNQLRHAAATQARAVFGLEGSQVLLGHAHAKTSEIYAEVNIERGVEIARAIG